MKPIPYKGINILAKYDKVSISGILNWSLIFTADKKGYISGNTDYNKCFHEIVHKGLMPKIKQEITPDMLKELWDMFYTYLSGDFQPLGANDETIEGLCCLVLEKFVDVY